MTLAEPRSEFVKFYGFDTFPRIILSFGLRAKILFEILDHFEKVSLKPTTRKTFQGNCFSLTSLITKNSEAFSRFRFPN